MKVIRLLFTFIISANFYSSAIAQDTASLNKLNRLSEIYQDKNTDTALQFAEQALGASIKNNYTAGKLAALNNIAWISYRKGLYKKASQLAFEALHLAEKTHDHNEAGKAQNTIGSVYNDQSAPLNSLQYFNNALQEFRAAKNKTGEGRVLNNLGYTAFKANRLDSALKFCEQAIAINKTLPNKYYLAFTYRTLGDIFKTKREFTSAYNFFKQSLDISVGVQNNFLTVTNLNRLGLIEQEMNKTDSAIYYYTQAEQTGTKYGFRSILTQAYEGLAKAYALQNNYRSAFEYQKSFSGLNDSLKNAANTETIAILQSNYDSEKREAEIALLKKDQELQKTRLAEQKQFITTLVIVVLLTFFFAIFLLRRYSYEKQFNKKINEQTEQLTIINKELKETVSFKDKVLSILSHDLRSPLASLSGTLTLLENHAVTPEEFEDIRHRLNRQLGSLNVTLDNILHWAMTQMKNNVRAVKSKVNFEDIINETLQLTEDAAQQKAIHFNIKKAENAYVFADVNHVRIILRNLISNAIKFSFENGVIDIHTEASAEKILVSVTDHGVGIPKDQQINLFNTHIHHTTYGTKNEKGTGIGLILSKEFIELNGGEISFESSDKGTSFHFSLPKFVA